MNEDLEKRIATLESDVKKELALVKQMVEDNQHDLYKIYYRLNSLDGNTTIWENRKNPPE